MALKQIRKIRDFGIFQKFDWDTATQDFNHFNLTYGWNYCGKTTLSRIFRCFELGQKHLDYNAATFEIEYTDGSKYTELNFPNKLHIRVFNTDFIADNLKWNAGIEPIFMLGEQNIKLQADLKTEKENQTRILEKLQTQEAKKKEYNDRIYWALSNKASEIKNTLTLTTFDKRHLEPKVQNIANDTTTTLFSPTEVQKLIEIYKSTERKSELQPVSIKLPDVPQLHKDSNQLLSIIVTAKVIEKLKNNSLLNEWVRQGKDLHKDKTECEFCGNDLPLNLLENLNKHFSEDYDNLLNNLVRKIKEVEAQKINYNLQDSTNFYNEFQGDYLQLRNEAAQEISRLNQSLQAISQKLDTKKTKVFEKIEVGGIIDNVAVVNGIIQKINEIITKHNLKTSDFEKQKQSAYEKLISNYALEFARTQKYNDTTNAISALNTQIEIAKAEIKQVEQKIISIEEKLSETVKGAEKINEYLSHNPSFLKAYANGRTTSPLSSDA